MFTSKDTKLTHPAITEAERIGSPVGEEEKPISCDLCEESVPADQIKEYLLVCEGCIEKAASYDMAIIDNKDLLNAIGAPLLDLDEVLNCVKDVAAYNQGNMRILKAVRFTSKAIGQLTRAKALAERKVEDKDNG